MRLVALTKSELWPNSRDEIIKCMNHNDCSSETERKRDSVRVCFEYYSHRHAILYRFYFIFSSTKQRLHTSIAFCISVINQFLNRTRAKEETHLSFEQIDNVVGFIYPGLTPLTLHSCILLGFFIRLSYPYPCISISFFPITIHQNPLSHLLTHSHTNPNDMHMYNEVLPLLCLLLINLEIQWLLLSDFVIFSFFLVTWSLF